MGLNIKRLPAKPGSNDAAVSLVASFYKMQDEQGVTFGFFTRKILKEVEDLLSKDLQVEDYDMEQLSSNMQKDVTQFFNK